jgi:hypothetical protein
MRYGVRLSAVFSSVVILLSTCVLLAQNEPPAPGANSDATYQQLRNVALSGDSVTVKDLVLKRDAGTFTFRSGTFCFLAPVQGKVTGAVFSGEGSFSLVPPIALEKHSLALLTKEQRLDENFSELVLRFTDSTVEEIKKSGGGGSGTCNAGLLQDSQHDLRKKLHYNLSARILEDVLSSDAGGLFTAFIHGKKYGNQLLYMVDPHGALNVDPEEVELMTYSDDRYGIWAAFHYSEEYAAGAAKGSQKNGVMRIEHQQLDTEIEKGARLNGKATTTIVASRGGIKVIPFSLFPSLRVSSVTGEGDQKLSFIQEDKNDDPGFFVILPKALAAGEKYAVTTIYSGKDAVRNEGGGNYYPVARENWYPSSPYSVLGEYATYDMEFRIPKGMKIAATGTQVSETNEGGNNITVWKSEVPMTVAGFNFGRFKQEQAKIDKLNFQIESFVNSEPPNIVRHLQQIAEGDDLAAGPGAFHSTGLALGNMGTTPLMKKALAEGQLSVELFSDYFGPLPFKRLAVTQQTADNYGQSWPTLVYLPITYFFDTTVRHQLGIDDPRGYFKAVTSHEVAHQWWGHQVGFNSYRDQWMSEGFADMSASLFLQLVEKNPQKFIGFWNDQRELLLERNAQGYRALDVGPVTMGYRLNNSRSGFNITRQLIYPKGAYILHMVRMMMWDRQTRDDRFKEMMRDFANTYSNQSATTEDFKAMVEKHMTPEMDMDGNHRMDWFFNQYVYGTQVPTYKLDYSFETGADGDVVMSFKLAQSGVDERFKMPVPLYLELANGSTVRLGSIRPVGNTTVEAKTPIRGLKEKPRRAMVNYYDDVLATP